MDIDSAKAEISQSSKIRGSPYPDPDVKINTRPIPAYKIRTEISIDESCSWHCYVYILKTEAIITLNQIN